MSLDPKILELTDHWLSGDSKKSHVAFSSRARYARNLAGFPFAPHSRPDVLERVEEFVATAFEKSERLRGFSPLKMDQLSASDRKFLKECRLISKEMERGGEFRSVYISNDALASVLVNEEDHLRLQVLSPGLELRHVVDRLDEIDTAIGDVIGYATSPRLGYLTACPTNVGSGFRASVMLHLPALTLMKEIDSSLAGLAHHGLTARGFYGENTEFTGDFFQISNEITLGKTVEDILESLLGVIDRLIEREEEARLELFKHHETTTLDAIWRSYGLLAHATRIDSSEAMRLLSRLRLGIDRGVFERLRHEDLNRLVLNVQPAHIDLRLTDQDMSKTRDERRANFLRRRIAETCSQN